LLLSRLCHLSGCLQQLGAEPSKHWPGCRTNMPQTRISPSLALRQCQQGCGFASGLAKGFAIRGASVPLLMVCSGIRCPSLCLALYARASFVSTERGARRGGKAELRPAFKGPDPAQNGAPGINPFMAGLPSCICRNLFQVATYSAWTSRPSFRWLCLPGARQTTSQGFTPHSMHLHDTLVTSRSPSRRVPCSETGSWRPLLLSAAPAWCERPGRGDAEGSEGRGSGARHTNPWGSGCLTRVAGRLAKTR
jgi:hypothetical protein